MPTTTQTLQKGRFSIEQELSSFGQCTYFQAYDTQREEAVSVVEIVPQLTKVATVSQRESIEAAFAARARSLSALKQKALPSVIESFTEAGRNYVITQCGGGPDLFSVIKDGTNPIPASQLAGWADSLLEALNALHSLRPPIVYRELNPQNVVLNQDGTVTLSISALFQQGEQGPRSLASGSSMIAFSPLEQLWSGLDAASQKVIINQYDEASERILKQGLDARSDIYSLGATLYFLATGQVPVDALERSIEMIEGNPDPLASPNATDPSVPNEVSDVIMKAMEVRREYRFDSAAIMRQVLKTALVRIKEREAALSADPRAAANERRPEVPRNGHVPANSADSVGQRLREAEAKRIEAERRAAEAERKLREAEEAQARVTESFNLSQLEDDVLGLLTSTPPHSPETVQTETAADETPRTTAHAAQEIDVDSLFDNAVARAESNEGNDAAALTAPAVEALEAASSPANDIKVNPSAVEPSAALEPEFSASNAISETLFQVDTTTSNRSFPFGLPVVAAAAVLLVVAAIGGWLMFGGGPASDAASTIQAQPAVSHEKPAEPPVQNAYQPADTSQQPAADPSPADPAASDPQTVTQPEKTAPVKAKKATPARTPAPKKAVTVDDLINDN